MSVVLLVVAGLSCVADWIAVARDSKRLEYLAKPLATAAFLGAAAFSEATHVWSWRLTVIALVFCLLGDVFLMLPRNAFVQGLGSFALAQVLLAAGFLAGDADASLLVLGFVVMVPVAALLARRFVGALRRSGHRDLVVPVCVYMAVISAMVVAAIAGGTGAAITGAVLFVISDSLIAETRFVRARPWQPVGIMVTYHGALAGLVLGLI